MLTSNSRRRLRRSVISCFAAPSSCASLEFSRIVSRNCVSTLASDVTNVVAVASDDPLSLRCAFASTTSLCWGGCSSFGV